MKTIEQEALERAYTLLLVPDVYNVIDGAFDTDAIHYLELALGEERSKEIADRVFKHFGKDGYKAQWMFE